MLTAALALIVILLLIVGALALFSGWTAGRAQAAVPPIGRFVDVDGARIHYLDEGSGPTIVLVHGLAAQMQHLSYALREHLKRDFRVVFMDRPGSGYSERAAGLSARLPAQGDTVAAFIRTLGLERPLLVGHSLGGAVALATALDHPDAIGGLALIAPLTHPQSDAPPALRRLAIGSPTLRRFVAWTLAVPITILYGAASLREVFAPDPVPADFPTRGGGLLALRPKAFYAASSDMAAVNEDLPDMVSRYRSIAMPVGILYGTADAILAPDVQGQSAAAAIPGATLDLVQGGGHMLPVAAVERTAAFIADIARRVRPSVGTSAVDVPSSG